MYEIEKLEQNDFNFVTSLDSLIKSHFYTHFRVMTLERSGENDISDNFYPQKKTSAG